MNRKLAYYFLILLGLINALTVIIGALTGPNAYGIANNLSEYYNYILCVFPLTLVGIAFIWWIVDIYLKPESRVNYLAIAFFGILADAVFVIGSILFASGH